MIEILTVVALFLLFRLLEKKRNNEKGSSADEKEKNCRKQQSASIVGESRFVLGSYPGRYKNAKTIVSDSEPSGKIDIEIPLEYEPENTDLLEEQEELEKLGLQTDYSANITFDEMMMVVNEVGNNQTDTTPETGKLLYENENTDWVEQLATSSGKNANRIAALIDLHLGRLDKPITDIKSDDGLGAFDIGQFV
ncbi:MAG: hypothetical protein HQ522_21125 [Bacteroidetes bacterium]|nr:hypothetical protein [Bacteroidota bacterium]